MPLRNAAHAGRCVVPPLLLQQKGLVDEIVGPFLPIFADESPVLRQWFDAAFRLSTLDRTAIGVVSEADRFAHRLVHELRALARRVGKMRCPVQIGFGERRRRKPGREARDGGVQRAVGDVRERRHAIRIAVFRLARAHPDRSALAGARRRAQRDRRRPGLGCRCFLQNRDLA